MDFIDYLDENFGISYVSGGKQVKLRSGPCPWCGTDRRDMRVYYSTDQDIKPWERRGNCHHCETPFSAIEFVMKFEECSRKEALEIIGGEDDPYIRDCGENEAEGTGILWPVLESIHDHKAALEYCTYRGITDNIIDRFSLMFSPYNAKMPNGDILRSANRIIFPIRDIDGNVISWQGRDITGESYMRYLFPLEFEKAHYVYNSHNIENRPDYLILTEGVMDSIGWTVGGFPSVVATFGKFLSNLQRAIIARINPKTLYMGYDTDANWSKNELAEDLSSFYDDVKLLELNGKDSDECSPDELRTALQNAEPYSWSKKVLYALNNAIL